MSDAHFNGLPPAQAERLALLAEECGEVIQMVGKILRHGYESRHPNGGPTNREMLECELGDVCAAIRLMTGEGDLAECAIAQRRDGKLNDFHRHLHHHAHLKPGDRA